MVCVAWHMRLVAEVGRVQFWVKSSVWFNWNTCYGHACSLLVGISSSSLELGSFL